MTSAGRVRRLVVYVDPDDDWQARVTSRLREAGLGIETVPDATAARDVLVQREVACVVSEYALPDGDGVTLLSEVRDTHGAVPFVLFTDSGDERVASDAVAAGVDGYVPKTPAGDQLAALAERVGSLVGEQPSGDTEEGDETGADETGTEPGHVGGDVVEALKDRSMDRAPVGISIADMRLPDEPLIYVNEAFERLTGYSAEETLGRNCRFLQGEDTDPEPIEQLRAAIADDEATAVELRNYTKDGEEFWNRVEIAPIRSVDGEVTHYVGYQTDVSARKRAEIAASKRADALAKKQASLRALLARIEGLLRDVSEGVISARTENDVEQQVCETLAEAEGYTLAWVGQRDPDGASVTVEASADGGDDVDERIAPDGALVETALERGTVVFDTERPPVPRADGDEQVVTRHPPAVDDVGHWLGDDSSVDGADGDSSVGSADGEDARPESVTRAVIPISYRETTYGVLGVHTDDGHAFDAHEAVVLSTLGRIVGTALNAVRTQSLLQSDAVVEIELSVGPGEAFVDLAAACDCRLTHVGTIPPSDDPGPTLFFEVGDADPAEVVTVAAGRDGIASATVVRTGETDGGLVRLSFETSPLVDLLVEYGGTIAGARAVGRDGLVTVHVPKNADARTFVEAFENRVPGDGLEAYREDERPARTNQEFVADVDTALTDRQSDALRTAYASGFFEWPRRASGEDVAEAMDISRSTFHQHLRAAERKLLDAFYDR
jgi:PAS domain S-box-containing protein